LTVWNAKTASIRVAAIVGASVHTTCGEENQNSARMVKSVITDFIEHGQEHCIEEIKSIASQISI
jgi:hypothetical protein